MKKLESQISKLYGESYKKGKIKRSLKKRNKNRKNHYKLGCMAGFITILAVLNLTSNFTIFLKLEEAKNLLILTFIANIFVIIWGTQEIKYRFNKAMGE